MIRLVFSGIGWAHPTRIPRISGAPFVAHTAVFRPNSARKYENEQIITCETNTASFAVVTRKKWSSTKFRTCRHFPIKRICFVFHGKKKCLSNFHFSRCVLRRESKILPRSCAKRFIKYFCTKFLLFHVFFVFPKPRCIVCHCTISRKIAQSSIEFYSFLHYILPWINFKFEFWYKEIPPSRKIL